MWIVSKFKSKEYGILYQSLKKTLIEFKIYTPKINIKLKKSSKTFTKLILGNYVFIYHKKFSEKKFISSLQNLKGLEYILPSFQHNQKEIEKFINHCKSFEDGNGFLTQGFFNFNKLILSSISNHATENLAEPILIIFFLYESSTSGII